MISPDFDGADARKLVEDCYQLADTNQAPRNTQYNRDYLGYRSFVDMTGRDPQRANIGLPKVNSIIETKVPKEHNALFATTPYIPFEATRDDFKVPGTYISEFLQHHLEKAGFHTKAGICIKMKATYGTSFIEPTAEYITQTKKIVKENNIGGFSFPSIEEVTVKRFALRVTEFAPWEVMVDPNAKGLEQMYTARFVIKLQLASKREIIKMAQTMPNPYPNLDTEEFQNSRRQTDKGQFGNQILASFGLPQNLDDDLGVLMRYESCDRYIDVWNGSYVIRDIPNPYKHKRINLSRFVHSFDPHTQNLFWGNGEAKQAEVLASMLNDLYNMAFDAHAFVNQPVIFYEKKAVDSPYALVYSAMNRIAVNKDVGDPRSIDDKIKIHRGEGLPADHYNMMNTTERMLDMGGQSFAPSRGENEGVQKTASEALTLKEAGDEPSAHRLKITEDVTLRPFGELCLSHIDQFAKPDDIAEVLGDERAAVIYTLNPADFPGGFSFRFKGSDRAMNQAVKQRNARELTPLIVGLPTTRPDELSRWLLETHEVEPDRVDKIVQPLEEVMMMQQMQAASDLEAQTQAEIQKGAAKAGMNTPGNEVQKQAQETTAPFQGAIN